MATSLFRLVAFTLVPLVALLFGIGMSAWYRTVLHERRFVLAGLLFALMAAHQGIELFQWTTGTDPHPSLLGETFETAVNLLAVASIAYIAGSLTDERRLATILADMHQFGFDAGAGNDSVAGASSRGPREEGLRSRFSSWFDDPVGDASSRTFGRRARIDEALERAVETLQRKYPIATFEIRSSAATEVVADDVYLQEILEILLEHLVTSNDASDPVVAASIDGRESSVSIRLTHNGTGFPDGIERFLGSDGEPDPAFDELVFVDRFVSRWGGSMRVDGEGPTLTLTFDRPRFAGLLG